jgi:hypothetical protein
VATDERTPAVMQEIDRQSKALNHDHLAFNRRIRFCPSCSLNTLQRHERTHDAIGKPIQGSEFWCSLCGFSFNVRTSTEWNIALRIFKEHRSLRGGMHRYEEKYVEPSVMEIWRATYEAPPKHRGTYTLADKLKAALGMGV